MAVSWFMGRWAQHNMLLLVLLPSSHGILVHQLTVCRLEMPIIMFIQLSILLFFHPARWRQDHEELFPKKPTFNFILYKLKRIINFLPFQLNSRPFPILLALFSTIFGRIVLFVAPSLGFKLSHSELKCL